MKIKKWFILTLMLFGFCVSVAQANENELLHPTAFFLPTQGGRIEYYALGKGSPIVLISGYAASASAWNRRFLSVLLKNHEVILFDNRNVGGSYNSSRLYTTAALAEDTDALIQALHLDHPAVVGISMGGMIAQQLAVSYPQDVSHLILINTAIAGSQSVKPSLQVQDWIEHTPQGKIKRFFIALRLMAPPSWWLEVMHQIRTDRFADNGKTLGVSPKTLQQQRQLVFDWAANNTAAAAIAKLNVPTLILNGGEDALIPPINSVILAKTIPHAQFERWADGGHLMPYQFPEPIAEAIVGFVDKH